MRVLPLIVSLMAVATATPVLALYKVVSPDGKVTYTDQPPPDTKTTSTLPGRGASPSSSTTGLPYALAQVVTKFPVLLYTREQCTPCDAGREHLKQRGVPFSEKTVNTAADATALQRLEGTTTLPVIRIGRQQLRGFAGSDWNSYLDAAGYPQQSALPSTYVAPPAQALVATNLAPSSVDATAASAPARESRPSVSQAPGRSPPPPPAGIKF